MKTVKLNFNEIENTLTRDEMKNIMAGSGGNRYCNIGGVQTVCGAPYDSLEECLDWCLAIQDGQGIQCNGCSEFPPL